MNMGVRVNDMPTIREQLASLFGLSISDPKPEKPVAIEPKRKLPRSKKSAGNSSESDSRSVSKRKKKREVTRKWVPRKRLKAEKSGTVRYKQNVSFENIHNAYNPAIRTFGENRLKKITAAAPHSPVLSSRQSAVAVVLCKFCNHPAMPGDGICRQCSSE